MEFNKNAINWFEIPVTDFERAKQFYSAIFDFEMPEMMMDAIRMGFLLYDQENEGVGGAIVHGEGCVPSEAGARVYLNGGSDLNIVLNRVENAGGAVVLPKTDIGSGFGFFALFKDTEDNLLGLHSMA
ncbi:VOC family protein [Flavobacterium sp.]|uniref:VOC family protein n=1 Tax=Flavobacterium sp. TaxID=239 RepID=UPI003D0F04EC